MNETPEQYAQRLTNLLGGREALEVLDSTVGRLEALARAVERKGLTQSLAPGKWTAAEILAHLAEAEIVVAYRLRRVLSASGGPIEAYDQNEWVKNSGYLKKDPALALSLFQSLRKANLAFLRSLSPEQWELYGIHSERGKESLRRMAHLTAGHDLNHLGQLESLAA